MEHPSLAIALRKLLTFSRKLICSKLLKSRRGFSRKLAWLLKLQIIQNPPSRNPTDLLSLEYIFSAYAAVSYIGHSDILLST